MGCGERCGWIQQTTANASLHRSRMRWIAHIACSAINGSGSAAARSSAGMSDTLPTLPKATHTLRRKPRRLIRLIAEFRNSVRKSVSLSSKYSRNDLPAVERCAENEVSRDT